MSKVLVTGATGHVASHIIVELLNKGYAVRGTVRSKARAENLLTFHEKDMEKGKLEIVEVPDITGKNAFKEAMTGCEYVMAVASPFSFHEEIQPKRDLVDPTIAALIHLLETAVATPSVKRVIITGSQATVFNYDYGPSRDYMYTEKDWNPVTYEQACNPPQDIYCGPLIYAYAGGKTLAEKAAWEFTRNNAQEKFDIVCILPSWIFDPTTWQPTSSADFSESNKIIYGLYQGQAPPSDIFPHWVDVRDVARAHVLAIEKRNAGGYRLIVNSGPFRVRDAIVSLKKLESRVVDPEHVKNLDKWCGMDNGKSVELLGMKYIGLDQCFTDMVEQFKKMTA